MSYLISILDFPDYTPLSVNVAPELVNPYIRDAYEFDIRPLLSAAEWALLEAMVPTEATDAPEPIRAVWAALRPVWVLQAFRLLLRWHGTHVTQNGLESFAESGQLPASGARRAELIADIDKRAGLYGSRLVAALAAYRPATASCTPAARRRPGRGGAQTHPI